MIQNIYNTKENTEILTASVTKYNIKKDNSLCLAIKLN